MKLRASDLKPGECYYSPTGRLCILLHPKKGGIANTSYCFAYLTKNRKPNAYEGFAIHAGNERAIASMRPASIGDPITVPVYIRARGM